MVMMIVMVMRRKRTPTTTMTMVMISGWWVSCLSALINVGWTRGR